MSSILSKFWDLERAESRAEKEGWIEADDPERIKIKEDFLWSLFGVDTTTQETLDYWNE